MNPKPWTFSPAYVEFARSVRELHRLAAEGREESPEADEIREASDGPWYALSEIERARAVGLSGDLDTLIEPPSEALPMNPQAQSNLNECYEARERGDWDRALELLRRLAKSISPALLAFLRGTVWRDAGDRESAALFFERAHRLEPEDARYFTAYVGQADPAKVRPEIDRVLNEPESQPLSLIVSSIVAAGRSVESCTAADYRRFAGILQQVLGRSTEGESSLDARLRLHGHLFLGLYRERLNDPQAAADAYTRGLALDPDDALLLAARGLLGYGSRPGAVDDLERAVRVGVAYIWPYYFLTHHRFREGRFQECLRFGEDALRLDGPDAARSEVSEWVAIARAELGFSPAMVREAFEEAVRLDPSNERARRNRAVYEARLASSPSDEPRPFEARTPREVRASVPLGIGLKGAA